MVELLKVIKFEGDDKTLVWKHPAEDFNTQSTLVVHESQVAVLYKNGQALDIFGPGNYTLETENIPLLRALINIPTEGVSPFHCEVYFVNKAKTLNVNWGTSSRFPILDPMFNIPISVGASGVMELVVDDVKKFLINVVGTQNSITADDLTEYFKLKITSKVKTYLSKIMSEVSYYNISQNLNEVSEALHEKLKKDYAEYGVDLISFYISNIIVPKQELQKLEDALNKKMEYGMLGYNWADEQMADISKKYASNPGNKSEVDGMITSIPMAMTFGQMLSDGFSENFKGSLFSNGKSSNSEKGSLFCTNCGNQINDDSNFCPKCGTEVNKGHKCDNCGATIDEGDKFCSKCGNKIEE